MAWGCCQEADAVQGDAECYKTLNFSDKNFGENVKRSLNTINDVVHSKCTLSGLVWVF